MKTPAWLKSLIRFFGLDHPIRFSVCRRPLRGKWAKVGIGPKCSQKKEEEKQTAPVG